VAVSGSKNFALTRAQIIESALLKIGEYDQGESIPGDEITQAARSLNMMVKAWVGRGIDLFLRREVTLFLQPQSKTYLLGSTAHATTSYVETTLSADEALGQTELSVTSETGISVSDFIGIKLDDDSIHWTTVASLATLTVADALPSAASSGNKVYAYTTKVNRPQKLLYAFRRDTSNIDTQVSIVGENEYQNLSNKLSEGEPIMVWYRPTLDAGTLHVWPVDGGKNTDKLIMIAQVLPDDFDDQADNPQFPIEWGEALVYNLASRLSRDYGLPLQERLDLKREAEMMLDEVLDYDVENASVIFTLDRR